MQYTTKKCPHCKTTYQNFEHNNYRVGSPIVTCSYCQGVFIDKDRHELALEPYDESGYNILNCWLIAFFPCGLMALISLIILIISEESLMLGIIMFAVSFIAFIAIAVTSIKDLKFNIQKYRKDYAESEQRLENKEYAWALKKLGYDVPSKYL